MDAWTHNGSPRGGDPEADTGSTSPASYAYSWLSQSAYRTDRDVATYPSNGLATYEGKALAVMKNNHIYMGDALVRVTWNPLTRRTTARSPRIRRLRRSSATSGSGRTAA